MTDDRSNAQQPASEGDPTNPPNVSEAGEYEGDPTNPPNENPAVEGDPTNPPN